MCIKSLAVSSETKNGSFNRFGRKHSFQLGLLVATLWAPWLLDFGREWVALAGGGLASLLVFALAWRRGLAPLTLILAGLVVTLYLSALNVTLMLVQQQDLNAVFIWGSGSLSQNSWMGVHFLLPRL